MKNETKTTSKPYYLPKRTVFHPVCIFVDLTIQKGQKCPKLAIFPLKYKFLIEKYEKKQIDIKMYVIEFFNTKFQTLKLRKLSFYGR